MDYCRIDKKQTKNIGKPEFIKKNKRWRRISTCKVCKSQKNNMSKSPEDIEIEELFKPVRKRFETRHFIQKGIDDTWQADLYVFYRPRGKIEDPSYSLRKITDKTENNYKQMLRANDGYRYILNIIDTFSKYVWSIPLKTKSGLEVSQAFSLVFKNRKPKKLHVDRGKEFYNRDLQAVLKENGIQMNSTGTDNKASIVERFNRTLGEKLKPYLFKNPRWIDVLPKIIKQYNSTYHRTIKMKPIDVTKDKEDKLLSTVYYYEISQSKPKYEIGDRVRLSAYVDLFRNKLKTNWTKEIFTISKVIKSNVVYYKVEGIQEGIYEEELQLSKF